MIKKLRRRFIAVNMCILTSVLIGVLSCIYAYMYSSEVRISYALMESLLNERENEIGEAEKPHEIENDSAAGVKTVANLSFNFGENRGFNDNAPDNGPWNDHGNQRPVPDKTELPPEEPPMTRPNIPDWEFTAPEKTVPNQPIESDRNDNNSEISKSSVSRTDAASTKDNSGQSRKNTPTDEENINTVTTAPESSTETASVTTAVKQSSKIDTVLITDNMKPPFDKKFPDPYKGSVKRAYIMLYCNENKDIDRIVYQYFEDADEEQVKTAAKTIIMNGSENGKITIGDYKLRYMMRENQRIDMRGFKIVFLDRTLEISTINRLIFIFIIIGGIGIIVIFGISVMLANWMIKPVERAWNQQKQFVADASHELKTPLTVISSNTDVILSNSEDTVRSQEKWLNYIKEETKRMTKLVNNMLYIAKYDSNEIKFSAVKFDLSDVMSSICLQYEPLFFEKGRLFESDIEENIQISGDEDKFRQLINILLDNAGKYSSENGKIKAILLKEQKTGKIILTVANTSDYIPAEKLDRLFDRFYRLDDSRNRKTGGSGLGLNIAKSIVETHGGKIKAKHENSVTFFIVEI